MPKTLLSIIIVNYNTKEVLIDCLNSIRNNRAEVPLEVIVSDNGSEDGSGDMIRTKFPWVKLIQGSNVGFSRGNNRARKFVNGEMVLFLNPDTILHKNTLLLTVDFLKKHKDAGAVTCRLILPDGRPDKDVRRRFPTPWISFQHLILGNDKAYRYEDMPQGLTHEVESIQGAFFLTRKNILDKVGWFDPEYFFDGEDIDLCFQIKKIGYKIFYFPDAVATHLKGVTKGKHKKWKYKVTFEQRKKVRLAGVDSMERFFRKNLWEKYPLWFDYFVLLGIKVFRAIRYIRVVLLSGY